jgi:hypothetical protein
MGFELFAEQYKCGLVLVTISFPFDHWTDVLGSERLTGAQLDRLTNRVHILEMNGESYHFKDGVRRLCNLSTRHRPTEAAATTEDTNHPGKPPKRPLTPLPPRANLQFGW